MTDNKNELYGFSEQQLATMIEEDLWLEDLYNLAQERRFYINDLKKQIEKMKCCGNCKHSDHVMCWICGEFLYHLDTCEHGRWNNGFIF